MEPFKKWSELTSKERRKEIAIITEIIAYLIAVTVFIVVGMKVLLN